MEESFWLKVKLLYPNKQQIKTVNFSVIIPSKDRRGILQQSLDRLKDVSNLLNLEVIIINDSDKEIKLGKQFDFVTIYKNDKAGVASARNFGASKARHDWLVFMDDDMWVQADTFHKLVPFCKNVFRCLNANWIYPDMLVRQLGQNPFLRYLRKYGFDSLEGWSNDVNWNYQEPFRVNGITSQFLLMHKTAFFKVGGYDTSFPFAGFEDHDMSKRLKDAGVEVYVDPQNMIYHNEADRINIENWLERKRRGAITRKVAVDKGYKELVLTYSTGKSGFYKLIYNQRNKLLRIANNWPNIKTLDKAFFLLINILLGTYSCIGYTKDTENSK